MHLRRCERRRPCSVRLGRPCSVGLVCVCSLSWRAIRPYRRARIRSCRIPFYRRTGLQKTSRCRGFESRGADRSSGDGLVPGGQCSWVPRSGAFQARVLRCSRPHRGGPSALGEAAGPGWPAPFRDAPEVWVDGNGRRGAIRVIGRRKMSIASAPTRAPTTGLGRARPTGDR